MNLSQSSMNFLEMHKGKTIVFTNGCFDVLHAGHVSYLNEAKKLGDLLFIGLNSDASVKRLKGSSRPICTQEERKYLLENLKCVDCVEIFEDDTPLQLILAVRPMILVKGGDWKREQIVGYDFVESYGGSVKSLSFMSGFSSTAVIERIQKI